MNINQIEEFCDKKARETAKIIASEYDQTDFDVETLAIEKEIFEVSAGYASIVIFEERLLISSEDKEKLKSTIIARFDASNRVVGKMSLKDLIAHLIKSYTINHLNEIYDLILV